MVQERLLVERLLRVGAAVHVPYDAHTVDDHDTALLDDPEGLGESICPVGLAARVGEHRKRHAHFPGRQGRGGLTSWADGQHLGTRRFDLRMQTSQLDGVVDALLSGKFPHEIQCDLGFPAIIGEPHARPAARLEIELGAQYADPHVPRRIGHRQFATRAYNRRPSGGTSYAVLVSTL